MGSSDLKEKLWRVNELLVKKKNRIQMIEININFKCCHNDIIHMRTVSAKVIFPHGKRFFIPCSTAMWAAGIKTGQWSQKDDLSWSSGIISKQTPPPQSYRTTVSAWFEFICEFAFWADLGTMDPRLHPRFQSNYQTVPHPPLYLRLPLLPSSS